MKLFDINRDEINCTPYNEIWEGFSGGANYGFRGEIQGTTWSLSGYGEAYPFDVYYVNFGLMKTFLSYDINETTYNPAFSFNTTFTSVDHIEIPNIWSLSFRSPFNIQQAGQDSLYIGRNDLNPQFVILLPLFVLLTLVALSPFSKDKNTKVSLYSAILVFAPMFVFAIQTFIPSRTMLSIPEFLAVILLFSAAVMFAFSFPKLESEKMKCCLDVIALALSFALFAVTSFYLFSQVLWYPPITTITNIVGLVFSFPIALRILIYRSRKKKQKTDAEIFRRNERDYLC